jgi:hypothetical protein
MLSLLHPNRTGVRWALHGVKAVVGTALLIVIATVMTTSLVSIVAIFLGGLDKFVPPTIAPGTPAYFGVLVLAALFCVIVMGFFGAVLGALASFFSLAVGAVTMPPVLALAHWLKLPRPAVDVAGGAAAAAVSAYILWGEFQGTSYGEELTPAQTPVTFAIAILAGALLGRVRYALFFPEGSRNADMANPR